jgi:hypothetical protein
MNTIDLSYPGIRSVISNHLVAGRTESRALLAWFLEHFYRLEETDAQDAVCDGPDDKGIDGIYVDDNLERIDVLQSRLVLKNKGLGDVQLKEFRGTLSQFDKPSKVTALAAGTRNLELRNLINSAGVVDKLRKGYAVRGVFVTNAMRNADATKYLRGEPSLNLYDRQGLTDGYVPTGPTPAVGKPVTFDIFGFDSAEYQAGNIRILVAPLSATDLIKLDGLPSGELFAWNVRQSLGRTKVNKDIGRSIGEVSEHKNFLLYHNGLTILCKSVKLRKEKITISGYSVVNGCQSLTSLYDHRQQVSGELRILARLIELPPDDELAEKITHHSNNQNPINARDLQANSTLQRRLQNEFASLFGGIAFYAIKRGEKPSISGQEVIENDAAARILLAFDLQEPWTSHQTYKLFDELHTAIFARPEVNALRIMVQSDAYAAFLEVIDQIEDPLIRGYRLTDYFILYLLRIALDQDKEGKAFVVDPSQFVRNVADRAKLKKVLKRVLSDVIIDFNAEIRDRVANGNPLDYKRELKSASAVRSLARSIIPVYQKAVSRGRASSFGGEWTKSIKTKRKRR